MREAKPEPPPRLRVHVDSPSGGYTRDPSLVGVPLTLARRKRLECEFTLEEERVGVVRSAAAAGLADHLPVYRNESGAAFVPTGRVFVRFAGKVRALERAAEIRNAGFEVESVPSFAPHAAWLRASDGSVVSALRSFGRLRKIPDVASVEPQLLAPLARKTTTRER